MGRMKLAIGPQVLSLLATVNDLLSGEGVRSYLVGGFVRDALLGRGTADIDIAVARDGVEVAQKVADALGGSFVLLDRVNRVGRVVIASKEAPSGRWELDFSTFQGSIEQDLARRDFTIDAIAVDPGELAKTVRLIDPFNGWADLKGGIIRAVSEKTFEADAVRLLRAVRLAAELGFSLDAQTEAQLRDNCHLISGVAGERVREEFLRLLAVPRSRQFLPYLDELGLITAIIPELAGAKGVEQPKEHFRDVFDHSIETVITVDFVLRQGDWEYAGDEVLAATPWSEVLAQHFSLEVSHGSTRRVLLKLAALLHDVAKPQTKAIDKDGRMRFLGHGKLGATVAAGILERLRFSGREIKLVEVMVREHLRPTQMSQGGLPTRRAIYRYFRDTEGAGIDILFLSLADHLATRGPGLELGGWREHARTVEYVLAQHFEQGKLVVPAKLLSGHDIINTFGLHPGPKIGKLLEALREAQASGEITTREEALAYIRQKLTTEAVNKYG
jgi:poly(A) polymerase